MSRFSSILETVLLILLAMTPMAVTHAADPEAKLEAAAKAEADASLWTYEYLLATARTDLELAPVTDRGISEARVWGKLPENELTDFAAEVLLARFADPEFPVEGKVRLIRVLDAAKSRRYGRVLTLVRDQTRQPKVKSWARAANRRLIRSDEPEYVPGSIDIHAIVAAADAAALAATPDTAQGKHLAEFPGATFGELFTWMGRPHHVSSLETHFNYGLPDTNDFVTFQRVTFFYRGIGSVTFSFRKWIPAWEFHDVIADPLAFEDEMPYRARAAALRMPDTPTLELVQLVSGYEASMKTAIVANYLRGEVPLEFLDTAAEILAGRIDSPSDETDRDSTSWLCRLLAERGGVRYAPLLKRVSEAAERYKLRHYASRKIKKVAHVPAQPWQPGTISLTAQRAKYPSLYPQSTYESKITD